MKERDWHNRILTIPNVFSVLRILLIPLIVHFYVIRNDRVTAFVILAIACLTDLLDGWIARRWNMISDIGKALDVIADKLMQIAVLLCAAAQYRQTFILIGLMVVKELTTGVYCLRYIRTTGKVSGAQWFGKVCTAVLDGTVLAMCLLNAIPEPVIWALVILCATLMIFSFVSYVRVYRGLLAEQQKPAENS